MKCSMCGWDTADKVVLRDEWGTIRATHNGPVVQESPEADRIHGLMDRFPFCLLEAECKPCRDTLAREAERERMELSDPYGYGMEED